MANNPQSFMYNQQNSGVYNPPRNQQMITMDASFEPDVMKQVIGRDGCYFKQITEQTGVSYIWHQRDSNKVEIWGPQNLLQLAVSSIQYRIYTVMMKMAQNNQNLSQGSLTWLNGYHTWYQSYMQNMMKNGYYGNNGNNGNVNSFNQQGYNNYNMNPPQQHI